MKIVLAGSIANDYLMSFPGRFSEHILPGQIENISLSFLVDSLTRRPGGIAANIAYTLALLGEHPLVMATVGPDYEEHRKWLEEHGVDTSAIRTIPDKLTASFFVNTDETNSQIASFYPGAMSHATELSFRDIHPAPDLAVISPTDPAAMVNYSNECVDLGIPYLYDPSQQIVRLNGDEIASGIRGARMLFCNDYELGMIHEKTGFSNEDLLQHLELMIVTKGSRGSDLMSKDFQEPIPVVPPLVIIDPTGVGDAYRGGFLKGYAHGVSFPVCARMGSLAATYCLEAEGPQGHVFDLESFLERYRGSFGQESELGKLTS
jgi:adenosine kinase